MSGTETDFSSIGKLVTKFQEVLDTIKGGAIRKMQASFDHSMSVFDSTFNAKLHGYQGQMNLVTKAVMEVINGANVYNVAGKKVYTLKTGVENGGYQKGANIDPAFPNVADPSLPPTYFNLIEFVARDGFGAPGDLFRVEVYQTHRGMIHDNYTEHFVFTGTSCYDSVTGFLEVKKTTERGGICLFTSQPNGDREISITKDMEGQIIPLSLRDIGQGYDSGIARLTMKQDTRHQAGATRILTVNAEYTSDRAQPPVSLVNHQKVSWSK